jgi:hypothetical protein
VVEQTHAFVLDDICEERPTPYPNCIANRKETRMRLGELSFVGWKKTWEKKGHSLAEELGTGEQNELPGLGEEED